MKALPIILAVIVGIIVFTAFSVVGIYNSMVTANLQVDNVWGQVETQYQRRFDLIPNLVNATKGVMSQEREVFGAIADARTHYAGTQAGTNERVEATNQYESAISRLLLVMENYPQLRSVETVQSLMDELSGTENRVLVARNRYNEAATEWNVSVSRFPRSLFAALFGFDKRELFTSTEGAQDAPTVDLNLN